MATLSVTLPAWERDLEAQNAALEGLRDSMQARLAACRLARELERERRRQDHRGPRVPFTGFPPYQFGGNPVIPDWWGFFSDAWGYHRGTTNTPPLPPGGRR